LFFLSGGRIRGFFGLGTQFPLSSKSSGPISVSWPVESFFSGVIELFLPLFRLSTSMWIVVFFAVSLIALRSPKLVVYFSWAPLLSRFLFF